MSNKQNPSLYFRLMTRVLLLIFSVTFLILLSLYISIFTTAETLRDRGLNGQTEDIAKYFVIEDDIPVLNLPDNLRLDYAGHKSEYIYTIIDEKKKVIFSSVKPSRIFNQSFDVLFKMHDSTLQKDFFGATRPKILNEKLYYIQVVQSADHDDLLLDTLLEETAEEAGWILAIIILGLMGVISVTIRTTLKPISIASDEAQRISPKTADLRISETGVPLEILPLVQGMNDALTRLENGFKQQREFTANAAHELRTPLAVLRANLDNAKNIHDIKRLTKDVERMSRLVSQLLKVSQLESLTFDINEDVDLKDTAIDVAAHLTPLALKNGKMLEVKSNDYNIIKGNAEAIRHAIRNLMENALEHTPINTHICIDVTIPYQISVIDHGSGIPDIDKNKVLQRFWRSNNKNQGNGAGLGLSIVSATMEQHHGEIKITDTKQGGACFTLIFPSF